MARRNLARWLPLRVNSRNPQEAAASNANTTITMMRFFMRKSPNDRGEGLPLRHKSKTLGPTSYLARDAQH